MEKVLEQIPDLVCQFNHEGQLIYLNPAGRRLFKVLPGAPLNGLNHLLILPEWGADFLLGLPQQAVSVGSWVGRVLLRTPHGELIHASNTVLVHRNTSNEIETVSMVVRDIPARAPYEQGRDEAIMQAVADVATTMIGVLDSEMHFLFLNRAFERQFNVSRTDWIGRPVSDLLEPDEYSDSLPLLKEALSGQLVVHEETYTEGDQTLVLEMQYSPLECTNGRIEGIVWIARDITDARAQEAKLRNASLTDPLTKILNRAGFDHGMNEHLESARAQDHPLALLCLDLDGFKPVNDKYGHPVGDALLCAVASRLRNSLRSQDLVARMGGDEFAVLLSHTFTAKHVEAVAAKVVDAISQPFLIDKRRIGVGVSVGYCIAPSDCDANLLMAQADAWLYEAKRAGRGVFRGGLYVAD